MNIKSLNCVLAVVLGIPSVTSASSLVQWNSGTGANDHYYLATDNLSTWTEANALATSLGGYLASITTQQEQSFLESAILGDIGSPSSLNAYWIGFTDSASEGNFLWTSGEVSSFTNWSPGEPNNAAAFGGGEDFTVFNWSYSNGQSNFGRWNDTPDIGCTPNCTSSQSYKALIEFDSAPTTVPLPGAIWFLELRFLGWVVC